MKLKRNYIFLIGLVLVVLGARSVNAQGNIAQQAYAIFQQNCLNCHGEHGAYTENIIIEHTALIETGAVVPGKPIESELYKRLLIDDETKRMPLGQSQLPPKAILTIGNWIQAGAPDWQASERKTGFITPTEMLETIEKHVNSLAPFDRAFTRYFTMTHLYNAGESAEALHAYQRALSKLVNSLSWGREVIKPQPIDPEETIFYIDLRDYEWEIGVNRWTLVEQMYPYRIEFDAPTQTGLREKLTGLREQMECEVPFVHVDWFLATASLPPLYHDILDLPETDRELETRLEVNVVENIRNAAGRRVWRAGFNNSGVSSHNRVVERHISRYGAYWKSYDFAGSVESQNIFTHPLSFIHDGGENIFNLPNGLQAYYLADAGGNRLDAAPIKIVRNPAASDPTVRNGLSCIGCHTEGMKAFEDQVRGVVAQNPNPPFNKDRALRLYVEKPTMDALVDEDTERYRQALEKTGDVFGGIEPVQRFHEAFQRPLRASHAAAVVGLETVDFLQKVRENTSLKNLGLGVLTGGSGSVKRDTWTSNFSEIVAALSSPDSTVVKPVTPRTERIPGASVHIPDPNLRAAIAEALNKAPRDTITVEDMAPLTHLDVEGMDIQDLEGLQFAANLQTLNLRGNPLSDLSPLSGLTALKEVIFSGESLSDLSPLTGLTNLEVVRFWKTSISDLSPLAGLTKLRWLQFESSPISDLSPLVGLTGLERLRTYASKNLDLLPLKGLTDLVDLAVANSGVSDVSPLSGLIHLEWLNLEANRRISNISSLASLKNLKELRLDTNNVSDVSPLATLENLEILRLERNNIADISPLDGLRENTKIYWFSNPGFPEGGSKIEGPWLWVLVQGDDYQDSVDLLSQASDGAVTELDIATRGAEEGSAVGENVWTSHKIAPAGEGNIGMMLKTFGIERSYFHNTIYGSIILNSPREQKTTLFTGSTDDGHRVWLNGELVHEKFDQWAWGYDYQFVIPVTLKQGPNVLLVASPNEGNSESWKWWSGYFGFAPDAEYTLVPPGTGIVFSTDTTNVRVGDTFTLRIDAGKVTDLSGWQFDLTFDPDVLEAVKVNEGDFLKKDGGTTFFQRGAIDNAAGKITGLSAALISESGVTGTGTVLSVVFAAKADGNSQMALHNFQLGSGTGEVIPVGVRDLTITVASKPKWDVNADGQVSVLDLILVARHFGEKASANSNVDVNNDGVVSILDLILVARHMGESTTAAAPSFLADIGELNPEMIRAWIEQARVEDDGSVAFREGIAYLQSLLALLIPEETLLLPNYPNPFNPETWIPYQVSESTEVTLRIYSVNGVLVRTLALGQTPAGIYQSRSRAAYWDGRNDVGESVASGIYFYTLTAGDFTATRKMLIRK